MKTVDGKNVMEYDVCPFCKGKKSKEALKCRDCYTKKKFGQLSRINVEKRYREKRATQSSQNNTKMKRKVYK